MKSFKNHIEEAYRKPTQAEIDADKKKENAGKNRPSMDHKSAKKSVYKNMMGGLKKEKVELDEAATPQMKKAAASIEAYAKKSGGIDKADFMKAAKMLSSGNAGSNFIKFVDDLDTEPREWLITNLAKTMGKQTVEKMFKVKIREEVELTEADIAEILRQYALSENVNADQLAELTEEEINEIIGKAVGGAFKLGAKAVVGAGRMAKKAANRTTVAGRADAAEKKANALEKKNKDRERIQKAQQRLRDAKKAARSS